MPTDAIVILCTAPDVGVATRLAQGLVAARLAACVNVIPEVQSVYVWKGQVESEKEVQLVIKSQRSLYDHIEAWLRTHHPYEVPEILAMDVVAGSKDYLGWVHEQTTTQSG